MLKLTTRLLVAGAAAAVVAGSLAAAGTAAAAPSGVGVSAPAADSPGLIRAKKIVALNLRNPSGIGVTTPLKSRPATGKFLVGIGSGSPASFQIMNFAQEAANVLGWRTQIIQGANTPDKIRAAMQQAIDLGADGIWSFGYEPSTYGTDLIAKTTAKNIPVALMNSTEPQPSNAPNVIVGLAGPATYAHKGQVFGASIVAMMNGNAHAQIITYPITPILSLWGVSTQRSVKALCPTCSVDLNPFTPADEGVKIPGAMVSVVQRNPATNVIVGARGDSLTGLASALNTAGFGGGKVQLAVNDLSSGSISEIKNGTIQWGWAQSNPIVAWRTMDAFARAFQGMAQVPDTGTPGQILTQKNIAKAIFNPDGTYVGVGDYQQKFKKLWRMS